MASEICCLCKTPVDSHLGNCYELQNEMEGLVHADCFWKFERSVTCEYCGRPRQWGYHKGQRYLEACSIPEMMRVPNGV